MHSRLFMETILDWMRNRMIDGIVHGAHRSVNSRFDLSMISDDWFNGSLAESCVPLARPRETAAKETRESGSVRCRLLLQRVDQGDRVASCNPFTEVLYVSCERVIRDQGVWVLEGRAAVGMIHRCLVKTDSINYKKGTNSTKKTK